MNSHSKIIHATLNGQKIRYRITEVDDDCIYATDCDTGKKYAWDRHTYELNNNKRSE
jgi:hypothetical protein